MAELSKLLRIFVVDDEDIIASTLELILCQKGFDATSFSSPLDVLKAAQSAPPLTFSSPMCSCRIFPESSWLSGFRSNVPAAKCYCFRVSHQRTACYRTCQWA